MTREFTKSQVNKFISDVTKDKYEIGDYLDSTDTSITLEILALSSKFSNITANKDYYKFKVDNYRIASGRKVRMLWACHGKHCMPIPKSQLMSSIWPPKKKQTKEQIHLAQFKQAARQIIGRQIKKFREGIELPISCPISKKKLSNWSSIHIDHIEPFSKLLEEWLDLNNLNPYEIALVGPATNKNFKDESLIRSWYEFHEKRAQLQAVYSKANLSKGAKTA